MALMKNIKIIVTLFFIYSLSFGCAKKGGQDATLSFQLGASFDSGGGAMLWGHNLSTGDRFADVISIQASYSKFLPFGDWRFWAIAWAGDSQGGRLTGLTKCEYQNVNIANNGSATSQIIFNLDNSKCDNSSFSSTRNFFTNAIGTEKFFMFPPIDIRSCLNKSFSTSWTDPCPVAPDSPGQAGQAGMISSVKIALISHQNNIPSGSALESSCIRIDPGLGDLSERPFKANIPSGGANSPFRTVIRSYFGSDDCDQADDGFGGPQGPALGFKRDVFKNGINGGSARATVYTNSTNNFCLADFGASNGTCSPTPKLCLGDNIDGMLEPIGTCFAPLGGIGRNLDNTTLTSGNLRMRVVLESNGADVCQGSRLTEQFAGGRAISASDKRAHIICTPDQFNSIAGDSTLLDKNYILGQDLNMNLSTEEKVTDLCGDFPRANTIPFGGTHSDAPACVTLVTSPTPFSGTFDGNGYTLSNIRIKNDNIQTLGLFRSYSGASISNLTIENADIHGESNVGILAGEARGNKFISNISILNSTVEADLEGPNMDSNLGGLFGILINNTPGTFEIENIFLKEVDVEGRASNVGGLIGITSTTASSTTRMDTISFQGDVEADSDGNSNISHTAGIVGQILGAGTTTMNKITSKGTLRSSGDKIGGLVGYLSFGDGFLKNFYSTMVISSDRELPAGYVGGLVGLHLGGNLLSNGFFGGVIINRCLANNTSCLIGEIAGLGSGSPYLQVTSEGNFINLGGINPTTRSPYTTLSSRSAMATIMGTWNSDSDCLNCFIHSDKDIPRLSFESSSCNAASNGLSTISDQRAVGRGLSKADPIYLCTREQMQNIGSNLGSHYMLKQDIYLGDFSSYTIGTFTDQFQGSLNGNKYLIYGMEIASALDSAGLFNYIGSSGSITTLKMAGSSNISSARSNLGLLAGTNNGIIFHIILMGGDVQGFSNIGGLVGTNNNIIENIWGGAEVQASNGTVGGIVGTNELNGRMDTIHSFSAPSAIVDNTTVIGGVAGLNFGYMNRVQFHSFIGHEGFTTAGGIGGIVGLNQTGAIIENALVGADVRFNLYLTQSLADGVGGIAGRNSGMIRNSLNLAGVTVDPEVNGICSGNPGYTQSSCTAVSGQASWTPILVSTEASIGSLVGINTGTLSNNFYYQRPYDLKFGNFSSSCTETASEITLTLSANHPSNIDVTDLIQFYTEEGPRVYSPSSESNTAQNTVSFNTSETCADIGLTAASYITITTPQAVNTNTASNGFQKSGPLLRNMDTYCPSAISLTDLPYFSCAESEFDMATSPGDTRELGNQRLLDAYLNFDFLNPPAGPIWSLEEGRFPRLFDASS